MEMAAAWQTEVAMAVTTVMNGGGAHYRGGKISGGDISGGEALLQTPL